MGLATARRDIEKRLQDNWALTPIAFDNTVFTPRDGEPWVRLRIFEENVNRINIGSPGYHRLVGLLVVSIFVPVGTGTHTVRGYADTIASIFRDVQFNGITCREAVPRTVGEVTLAGKETGWYQYDVSVRYQWDGVYSA